MAPYMAPVVGHRLALMPALGHLAGAREAVKTGEFGMDVEMDEVVALGHEWLASWLENHDRACAANAETPSASGNSPLENIATWRAGPCASNRRITSAVTGWTTKWMWPGRRSACDQRHT